MKIQSLTQFQKDRFQEFIDKWTKIGLSCEPAKRKEAELGINTSYKMAGKNPPSKIVWCDSPLSQGLTRDFVFGLKDSKIKIGKKMIGSLQASVRDSVQASVRDSVGDSLWTSVWDSVGDCCYGQHDANWLGFYDYFKDACNLEEETNKLTGLWQVSKNAGWWLPYENICWVSERHNILKRDSNGRLHADGQMALQYPDKWGIYAFHGVRIPYKYGSLRQDKWESKWILEEKNAELRRVLIQGIGYGKISIDLNAKKLDSWREYELLKIENADVEPILMVKMICPSTRMIHAHRVPPDMDTARNAIKWVNHGTDAEEFIFER